MLRVALLLLSSILASVGLAAGQGIQGGMAVVRFQSAFGLTADARRNAIRIAFSAASPSESAEALEFLVASAVEESNSRGALLAYGELMKKYPESKQAKLVKGSIDLLLGYVSEAQTAALASADVQASFKNAEFWVDRSARGWSIDTSWLPRIEIACAWYDKIIKKHPGSDSARLAYVRKFQAILGWKGVGRFASAHGVKGDPEKWVPVLVRTFEEFQAAFPSASQLQACRFQIAQVHWSAKRWDQASQWLSEILRHGKGKEESFFVSLARARLKKLRY